MEDEELIITREVLEKLRRRNEAEVLPFVEIFAANRKARKRCEKLQHEVQQLRNKTAELSGKNVGLMNALTRAQEENVKAKTSKENSAKVSRLQEELAEAHKKNVEFMESLPLNDLAKVLSTCHLGICILQDLPAMKNAFPAKAYDYIGAGLPILIAPNGELAEMTKQSGIGLSFQKVDPQEITGEIIKLKNN